MTSVSAPSSSASRSRLGLDGPVPGSPEGLPTRRRWGRFAAGVTLALLGGWIFAALYVSAGSRVAVLVVARDVGAYEVIEQGDLRSVRVAADPGVDTIDADDADELIGRVAAVALSEGALLSPQQVFADDERLVGRDEGVVGAELAPGDAPDGALETGTDVSVVLRPETMGEDASVREVQGWLLEVGGVDEQTGKRRVAVVVPAASAADVAAAASAGRVALVMLGEAEPEAVSEAEAEPEVEAEPEDEGG